MEDPQSLKWLLEKIKNVDSVSDALLMTKTGMFVLGSMRRSRKLERFMGMMAILMGSSEATSIELDEDLEGVVVSTKDSKIGIIVLADNILLVATFKNNIDEHEILKQMADLLIPSDS